MTNGRPGARRSGARWPGLHEFEIGCTLEHAGYALSWLVSLFGAVESLTAFSALAFPDKGPGTGRIAMAPDFSVGCLRFNAGMVAQADLAPRRAKRSSLTIVGDKGSIVVPTSGTTVQPSTSRKLGGPRKLTTSSPPL